MFEDSLVESQGRIRTKSRWFAIGSFFAQAALLVLLVLYPLLHPQALPKQSMERLLVAPPAPRAPARVPVQHVNSPASSRSLPGLESQWRAPRTIPAQIATATDADQQAPSSFMAIEGSGGPGVLTGMPTGSGSLNIVAHPPAPKGPVKISTGVATGLLLNPIHPVYPAIAKAARVQGTVIIEATISRTGDIENLQATEGPPMLRQAAIDAVSQAHYQPFLLNGEPVEVQTSIHVIFSLGH